MGDYNPGKTLKDKLQHIFPPTSEGFILELDRALKLESEMADYCYQSAINYVLRRIIHNSLYLFKKGKYTDLYETGYRNELKLFFKYNTHISVNYHDEIIELIIKCLEYRNKQIPKGLRRRKAKYFKKDPSKCYLSGNFLDVNHLGKARENSNIDSIPELDHIWPRTYGGPSTEGNLEYASGRFNEIKSDIIDEYDYDFPHVSVSSYRPDYCFNDRLSKKQKLAIAARFGYCCCVCEKPFKDISNIKYTLKDGDDSAHFFNLQVVCEQH